jgi:hypothetical protein
VNVYVISTAIVGEADNNPTDTANELPTNCSKPSFPKSIYPGYVTPYPTYKKARRWIRDICGYWKEMNLMSESVQIPSENCTKVLESTLQALEGHEYRKLLNIIGGNVSKNNQDDAGNVIESTRKDWDHWIGSLVSQEYYQWKSRNLDILKMDKNLKLSEDVIMIVSDCMDKQSKNLLLTN